MLNSLVKNVALPAAVIVAGFALIFQLSGFVETKRPKLSGTYADSDLSINGSQLKGFALGMEGLMADWYWMRSLQYIGAKLLSADSEKLNMDDLRSLDPRLLHPLLENATDLDPHFIAAYSFGAIILPAIDSEKAISLAKKGIANNPSEWRLYQHLGYIYWRLNRYDEAAAIYQDGASVPGSPAFMKLMSASMKSEGGSRATARTIYRQMLAESEDESARATADRRLKELDWLDERDAINRTLANFQEQNGRCAHNFGEILAMLMLVKLPENREFRIDAGRRLVDPTDAPYILDKEKCTTKLDPEKTKLPTQ